MPDLVAVIATFLAILAIVTWFRRRLKRRTMAMLGLLLILLPLAINTYRTFDAWLVLVLPIAGVVLLLSATSSLES